MQYWIKYTAQDTTFLRRAFGGTTEYFVESSNLAYKESDIRLLIEGDAIIGEELVYKSLGGWNVFQLDYYLFPIPINRILIEEEIKTLIDPNPKRITYSAYQLLKDVENLLYIENIDIHPSHISNKRLHKQHRIERIQKQQEKISNYLAKESNKIILCGNEDYLKSEILSEPPIEIRYFLPNHGEKRRRRRKPRP